MLKIAAIDLIQGNCVRLTQGDYSRRTTYTADPAEMAVRFEEAGFDRIHVVDLEGAREGVGRNRSALRSIVSAVSLPVQTGGGIRTAGDVEELLDNGVFRVILGTVTLQDPAVVTEWVRRWGPNRFIVSLDLRQGRLQARGWTEASRLSLPDMVARVRDWGIDEIISTDVERDGTLEEPNFDTYRSLIETFGHSLRIIAAGGVCRPEQIMELGRMGVAGVIIGRGLYEGEFGWEEFLRAGAENHSLS